MFQQLLDTSPSETFRRQIETHRDHKAQREAGDFLQLFLA